VIRIYVPDRQSFDFTSSHFSDVLRLTLRQGIRHTLRCTTGATRGLDRLVCAGSRE